MPEQTFLTPSSITTYWESPFAAWMDLWSAARAQDSVLADPWARVGGSRRDERTEEVRLLEKRGREHEAAVLARLAAGRDVHDVRRIDPHDREATLDAMRAGVGVIYQASLASEGLAGIADFLVRVETPSAPGAHAYTVWDAKLAHTPKPEFVLQVCAYVEMLTDVQGWMPDRCTIALGQGAEWRFAPREFFSYYRTVRRLAEAFHARFDPSEPVHPRECARYGSWCDLAERILDAEDHVSRVANITRSQVRRLEDAGLATVSTLAQADGGLKGMDAAVYARLRAQAAMQVASRDAARPTYRVQPCTSEDPRRGLGLLPPASPLDVFFDMEGDPLTTGGYEYLFGACTREGARIAFHDWWAYTTSAERRAFEGFIDWTMERRRQDPSMHIYHYAPYEVTAVRRLSTRYGTREAEVDDLLRHHVFVDLYQIVRQGLVVGSASYSLKEIEKLYRTRTGDITSAGASVVAFNRWRDAPDGRTCEDSPTLRSIRDYNESDCASLVHLVDWLRGVQAEAGIAWCPPPEKEEKKGDEAATGRAAERAAVIQELTRRASDESASTEDRRIDELLAWLMDFHWREMKPVYWEMFSKQERGDEENYDDPDCLVCDRTDAAPRPIDRSLLYEYAFDPDQVSIVDQGMTVDFVHDLTYAGEIVELDRDEGRLLLKRGAGGEEPPGHAVFFENANVGAKVIEDSITRYARARLGGGTTARAVDDLLARRRPRIEGIPSGQPLTGDAATAIPLAERAISLIRRMQDTTLCIQGPPGTGKTYTASHVIAALLADGRRVGVMSNTHKAVINLLVEVAKVARRATILKVGKEADPRLAEHRIEWIKDGGAAEPRLESLRGAPYVVGGTPWLFSREALAGSLDYLFVDEAGQVSLANIVGAGAATRNIVLVGDQMQLAQPVRGAHPGESGQSALVYLLQERDTIPDDMGLFLDTSWRMHPDVCTFVSETMYDDRLHAHPRTSAHSVTPGRRPPRWITRPAGILFVEAAHTGNTQWSDEEITIVRDLLADLNHGRAQTDERPHLVRPKDVLVVAPYNAQVRRLRRSLGGAAEIGTVDKFQGQEAPVVVLSLAASTIEEAPRGAEFLLSRNRINVAISRAQALAVVVASPALLTAHCTTIEDMRRVNLLCRLHDLGSSATLSPQTPADPAVTLFRSIS